MNGDGSLGYWSHETRNYSSHCCNDNDEISEEEGLEVCLGDERCGHRSLETSHSSSINRGGRGNRSFHIRPSSSRNHRRYHSSDFGRGVYRSQDTSHYSYSIGKKYLMLKGEVYIGLIQATIPTITQVTMVDC